MQVTPYDMMYIGRKCRKSTTLLVLLTYIEVLCQKREGENTISVMKKACLLSKPISQEGSEIVRSQTVTVFLVRRNS